MAKRRSKVCQLKLLILIQVVEVLLSQGKFNMVYSIVCILRVIPCNLLFSSAITLVHSFVMTRLLYCNSTMASLPKFRLRPIQSVFNYAVRVLASKENISIIEYMRQRLHWLPDSESVAFKIIRPERASVFGSAQAYPLHSWVGNR